jgi:hypothetical protein
VYTNDQIDGWREVTDAVHQGGGRIVIQLMHVGRISHPDNTPHGRQPVAPSAVTPGGQMFTATGMQDMPQPRELSTEEVTTVVQEFRHAAASAIAAGAEGVEIHAANGYLPQQFLSSNANQRTDRYGGSVANRIRFTLEVAAAIADEIGAGRTGIRISPGSTFNDIVEDDVHELYAALTRNCCARSAARGRPLCWSTAAAPTLPPASKTSVTALLTSSPSAACPWPTPTSSNASKPERRSTLPTPAPSTAGTKADTSTTPPSPQPEPPRLVGRIGVWGERCACSEA